MSKPEGVYMFMGVNGVGKSTLTTELANTALPDARVIHAAQELRTLFGGVSREDLEKLDPEEKLARRAAHLTALFHQAQQDSELVLLDTHLLVPIRQNGSVRYENTWYGTYTSYVRGAYMLTAHPAEIKAWREKDEANTGRKRDLSEENIAADQELNIAEFMHLINLGAIPANSAVIENRDGLIHQLGTMISNQLLLRS